MGKKSKYEGKYVLVWWRYNKDLPDKRKCNQIIKTHKDIDINSYISLIKKRSDCNYNTYLTNYDKIVNNEPNTFKSIYQSNFEICRNNKFAKLWFDIDECKLEYDYDMIDKYIVELFNEIDRVFGKKLDRSKYLVYYKKTPKYIYSFRIINYEYKIEYSHNSILINKIRQANKDSTNPFLTNLDNSVYGKDRQICLPYNAKPYNNKYDNELYEDLTPLDSPKYIFVDYNMVDKENNRLNRQVPPEQLIKYCISLTTDTKAIKLELTDNDKVIIEQSKISMFNDEYFKQYGVNRPKLLIDSNIDLLVDFIIEHIDTNVCEEINKKDWLLITYNLILLEVSRKQLDIWSKFSVECGDTDKYNLKNNKDHIDRTIDKLDSELELYKKLLKQKKNISNKPIRHTNNSVMNFKIISNILTKHNKTHYFYTDYVECNINNIITYICDKTEIDYKIVSKNFVDLLDNPNAYKVKKLQITEDCSYNLHTGDLYYGEERYNYIIENDYIPSYKLDNSVEEVVIKTIHTYDTDKKLVLEDNKPILHPQLRKEVDMFKNKESNYLIIEAECGVGKSVLAKEIIEHIIKSGSNDLITSGLEYGFYDCGDDTEFMDNPYYQLQQEKELLDKVSRIVMISPNNSLNKKEYQELKDIPNNLFTNHLDIRKFKDTYDWTDKEDNSKLHTLKRNYNILCSLESIEQISCEDYVDKQKIVNYNSVGLVILDEFNSIMSRYNLETRTFKTTLVESYNHFIFICATSPQILIMEADIDPLLLEHFENAVIEKRKELGL